MPRDISADELAALRAFAAWAGHRWKHKLNTLYWYNARIWSGHDGSDTSHGYALHGLRNDLGPNWLQKFSFPKEST